MCVWMKVSDDKYELPEIIADSAKELATKCGIATNSIWTSNQYRKKHGLHPLYVRVDIGEVEA